MVNGALKPTAAINDPTTKRRRNARISNNWEKPVQIGLRKAGAVSQKQPPNPQSTTKNARA
jgi:hypothetical protein